MWKPVKFVVGFAILLAIGTFYGKFQNAVDESSEAKMYGVISLEYPDSTVKMTSIKETPASKCEKWRLEYFEAMIEKCKGCKILVNQCLKDQPKEYVGVFEKQKMSVSYIYKPYKYPEVTVVEGLPEGGFEKICNIEKSNFEKAVCIE